MPKKPKQGQEGLHLPINQVDALRPNRRDCEDWPRPVFGYVRGHETVMNFGKDSRYPFNSTSSARRTAKGLVDSYPAETKDEGITLQGGIHRNP